MNTRLIAVALITLVTSGAALAVESIPAMHDKMSKTEFMTLDVNKDGYLERTEMSKDMQADMNFDVIADKGKLNEPSYLAWRRAHPESNYDGDF